jgi:hypothetical protein
MTAAGNERDRTVLFAHKSPGARRHGGAAAQPSDVQRFSLLRDYLGIEPRTLLVLFGLVAAAFVVVTVIYGSIFGFDRWASNMHRAGSLMVINYCPSCGGAIPVAAPEGTSEQAGGSP